MEGYRNILCAIDFSPHSEIAVGRAAIVASGTDAQLTLLHVIMRAAASSERDGLPSDTGLNIATERQANCPADAYSCFPAFANNPSSYSRL